MRRPTLAVAALLLAAATQSLAAAVTGTTGSSQPFTNYQPSLALNYLIDVEDINTNLGEITLFAGNFAPGGYVLCDGSALQISQNQALFQKLGTTYGSDGPGTFRVPDLRGRTAIGTGPSTPLGQPLGSPTIALTVDQLPAHYHLLPDGTTHTGLTGNAQPFSNLQPSLPLNYSLTEQGDFPSRGDSAGFLIPPFYGQIRSFAGPVAPGGYDANGQSLSLFAHSALYSLVGTNYGSADTSHFNVPDLQGRAPVDAHIQSNTSSIGTQSGQSLTTLTTDQIPAHFHTVDADVTSFTGGSQPVSDLQPSLALNYCIAINGVYPIAGSGDAILQPLLGEIFLFAGTFAPVGSLFCDGSAISRADNAALFDILGTTYGAGNGSTTFNLPNLIDRLAIGAGSAPGLPSFALGDSTGLPEHTLSDLELPAHDHTLPEPASLSLLLTLPLFTRRR